MVLFKQQYITNLTISHESHVMAAAQQLASALKGNIPAGNETGEALTKVSKLFTQIAQAKQDHTKAKEQCNWLRANPAVRVTALPPRVAVAVVIVVVVLVVVVVVVVVVERRGQGGRCCRRRQPRRGRRGLCAHACARHVQGRRRRRPHKSGSGVAKVN